jgi:hypothetical protein
MSEKFRIEWIGDILVLRLLEHMTFDEAHQMLSAMRAELEAQPGSLRLLIVRMQQVWIPVDAQIEAGRVMRSPNITRAAIVGPQMSGGAVMEFIGKIGHRPILHFDDETEAIRYLQTGTSDLPPVNG